MSIIGTIVDNHFDTVTLTSAINKAPYTPQLLSDWKLFSESGILTTKAALDQYNSKIELIPNTPRGAPPKPHQGGRRSTLEVQTAHFITRDRIYADSFQDVRGIGTVDGEQIANVQNRKMLEMRRNLDASIEHQRIGALKGLVTDSTGDVIVDLFAAFDQTQQTQALNLATSTTDVANMIVAAKRKAELALGYGLHPTGWLAIAAPDIIDGMRSHPSLVPAVQGWQAASVLRDDVRSDLTVGKVQFVEYLNPEDGPIYLASGEAYLIPLGVPDLFQTFFAPADYIESVNEVGIPYYAKAELGDMNRWIDLEAQSNPISICTRPRAVVKLSA